MRYCIKSQFCWKLSGVKVSKICSTLKYPISLRGPLGRTAAQQAQMRATGTASTDEGNGLLFLSFIMQASQSATIYTPSNGRDRLLFHTFQGCDVRTHKISGAMLKGECMLAVQVCPQTGSGVVAAGSAAAVPSDPLHNPSIFQEQCVHARLCVAAPRATFKGTVAGWIRDAGHAVG